MIKSETLNKLIPAMLTAQMEIGKAKKSSTNSHYKSEFADLEEVIDAVKAPLNRNGLFYTQVLTPEGVETTIFHTSGEFYGGVCPIVTSRPNDPQALGAAITYIKRYSLAAITGLATEDDDAESAMNRDKNKVCTKPAAAIDRVANNFKTYTPHPGVEGEGF